MKSEDLSRRYTSAGDVHLSGNDEGGSQAASLHRALQLGKDLSRGTKANALSGHGVGLRGHSTKRLDALANARVEIWEGEVFLSCILLIF